MRCKDCEYFISKRQEDATVQMICKFDGLKRWLVDGCSNGQAKIEEYEDKQVFTFDDMERLVRK